MSPRPLAFKQRFVEPILTGAKRQTLRKQASLIAGDTVQATCRWGDPPFARLLVTRVDRVVRSRLTRADAQADGFETLRDLLDFLDDTYGTVGVLWRISFEVEAPVGQ